MRLVIGRRFVNIFLVFLFSNVISSVLAQWARYSYTGPDGCTIDSCDCAKHTEQLEDDMGNSITLERTTCNKRDPERSKFYNFFGLGLHFPVFLHQITDGMFGVANRTKAAVVGTAGRIPEVALTTVQVITNGVGLIDISQVTVGVQSFWNTCMEAVNQYLQTAVTYSNWEKMENETTKPKIGANLFPSFTTRFTYLSAYFGSLSSVIHGNNEFSSKLYNVISTSNPNNLLLSPLGVSILMAMLHTGALGETEETLRTIMAFPSNDLELVMGYQSLINKLNQVNDDGSSLNLISGLFVNRSVDLNPIFNATLAQYFNVMIEPLDFTQIGMSTVYINSFVSASLNGHVKDIISRECFTGRESLVVVNALYFNNSWNTPFPKENTRNMAFHISATSHVKVDMMNMKGEILSGEIRELDARAVSLPYQNSRFSMVILLPFKRTSLHAMETKLRDFPLEQVLKRMTYRKVNLFLPKFKLESVLDLEIPLSELGLEPIFSEEANFSGISEEHEVLALSKAVQKVTLEVNEEMTMPARPNDVISHGSPSIMHGVSGYTLFFVGHPFFAMIYDHDLSTPVIMASIKNPSISFTNLGIPCAPSSSSYGARSSLFIFIISFTLNAMQ